MVVTLLIEVGLNNFPTFVLLWSLKPWRKGKKEEA